MENAILVSNLDGTPRRVYTGVDIEQVARKLEYRVSWGAATSGVFLQWDKTKYEPIMRFNVIPHHKA